MVYCLSEVVLQRNIIKGYKKLRQGVNIFNITHACKNLSNKNFDLNILIETPRVRADLSALSSAIIEC